MQYDLNPPNTVVIKIALFANLFIFVTTQKHYF